MLAGADGARLDSDEDSGTAAGAADGIKGVKASAAVGAGAGPPPSTSEPCGVLGEYQALPNAQRCKSTRTGTPSATGARDMTWLGVVLPMSGRPWSESSSEGSS